ncbi:MAG: glutathione S-transferase family protein [Bdellovibrionota bacterium]
MTELIGLWYSPYTEKARWALDFHQIPYEYTEHLILFGMPALRLKTRKLSGDLTVPVLIDDEHVFFDSFDIARWADQKSGDPTLFPAGRTGELLRYNALSETALDAGRALLLHQIKQNPQAQVENLPGFVPKPLRNSFRAMAQVGLSYLKKEFRVDYTNLELYELRICDVLSVLRERLAKSETGYLLGDFSYADIVMAVTLQFVKPIESPHIPLEPATRECWTVAEIASEFHDLLTWRDKIYQKHRFPSGQKLTKKLGSPNSKSFS